MIRKATLDDLIPCTDMVCEFYTDSFGAMGLDWNKDIAKDMATMLIKDHVVLVAEIDGKIVGEIAGMIQPWMFDPSKSMFQEISWYVIDEYRKSSIGLKLFKAAEKECKNLGFHYILMANLGNFRDNSLKSLYERSGYKHFETSYIKKMGE